MTIWAWTETSRAETGSSAMTRRGPVARARAIPMRWAWPPENSCGKRSICSGMSPTSSISSAARRRASAAELPCTRRGSEMMRATVWRGLREECGSWKTIWISRRSGLRSRCERWEMSWPS
ncbi:hypothetical protein A8W25_00175 [Streptomyces sp. ERV7]|nr:hypothetical protein A8W25_00175 [Streptomyces sp. ERV7]